MKILKLMSILTMSLLFVCFFTPELSARGQRCRNVRVKKSCRSSSFNVNLNVDSSPNYVAYAPPAPAYVAPAPYYQSVTTYNTPYQSVTTYSAPCAPAYYPYYPQPVVVEQRPAIGVYFQPSFSYWRY